MVMAIIRRTRCNEQGCVRGEQGLGQGQGRRSPTPWPRPRPGVSEAKAKATQFCPQGAVTRWRCGGIINDCKFSGDYNSERIFKVGQYLKLCVDYLGFTFLAHPV